MNVTAGKRGRCEGKELFYTELSLLAEGSFGKGPMTLSST